MKKAISFIAVLLMLFATAVPAMAADGEATTEKGTLFDYRFKIFDKEEAKAIAHEIATNSIYEPLFLEPNIESVIVCVDLRAYPELSNPAILVPAVREMVQRTHEFVTNTTEQVQLLSEARLAGELALHIAGLMLMDRLNTMGFVDDNDHIFEVLNQADMNIDEQRLPEWIMNLTGIMLMNIIGIIF